MYTTRMKPLSSDNLSEKQMPPRIRLLKDAVMNSRPAVCTERALFYTRYFKNRKNRKKPVAIQMAEALSGFLSFKSKKIYENELLVGNFSSKRVGGQIFPELHGLVVMLDLFFFPSRKVNPLEIDPPDMIRLASIIPFWLFRFVGIRAHKNLFHKARLLYEQLSGKYYLINEGGGISHIAPDYEKLVKKGTSGIAREAEKRQHDFRQGSDEWNFLEAVKIAAEGLARFGEAYGQIAQSMAKAETKTSRKSELARIAETCQRVPRFSARTYREALQSVLFAQIALNMESLDNSVCPGRMDQYLYPYYRTDIDAGRLTPDEALELTAAFFIKLCEIVPVFSRVITNFHGGMFNGQVVCVGGTDRDGNDSVNELTYIFLETADMLRMRQPNFHARIHSRAPQEYAEKIFKMLGSGANTPALYNDEVIVPTMIAHGYKEEDARNYTAVGCVEPVSQGKSFSSTDAAIFNVPLRLELALNQGRRFGSMIRIGPATPPVSSMKSMEDVVKAFEEQLAHGLSMLLFDLQAIERANAVYHPTPLTSMLLDGCIQHAKCSTQGGAAYNFSGIQCVGGPDTGDSLYAIQRLVFEEKRITLPELVSHLEKGLADKKIVAMLRSVPKYGNDHPEADRWTKYVIETFDSMLRGKINTRGGPYKTGIYSVTAHQYFGEITSALPSGRKKGEPFASGISPTAGCERNGPTAVINSANRMDFTKFANGINLNMKFDARSISGTVGRKALYFLTSTYFRRGGMQIQINVLDPETLIKAKKDPDLYPHLMVRVSGYSAYFNDLSPAMQDEIIKRAFFSTTT